MSRIKITALVQSYCGETRIIPTLESCKLQDYPYKDLVVADDASDDGKTISIIENWLKNNIEYFESVTFIKNSENLGIVKNYRNAALNAKGEIILPLGQGDTYYSPQTFSLVAKEVERQRKSGLQDPLVWLGYYKSYEFNPEWQEVNDHLQSYPFYMEMLKGPTEEALELLLQRNYIGAPSFVYHARYFQDGTFPIPETIKDLEDYGMSVWMLATGNPFGYLPLFVRWYEKGTGLSSSRNNRLVESLNKVYEFNEASTNENPKLNAVAKKATKMNHYLSIKNKLEREFKKAVLRLKHAIKNPLKIICYLVFSFKKKVHMKLRAPEIIMGIEAASGSSFDEKFFS